ncbi:MAG: phosphoribosyltransferase family protein [Candidatus Saccharibacteria bacterium]|nr:phosphoribosyltransferase family protein [Candidatus Saccharibacteria bacterium]
MYFESRSHAGATLAEQLLAQYRYENCAVLALSDGAVLVGEQIAWRLHCVLMLLLSESIEVPGEGVSFGAVAQGGQFTYNSQFTEGQIDGYTSEFYGYLEEQKREANQRLNRLLGDGGIVDKDMLRDRTVILVSDGFSDDLSSLDVALNFLKSIRTERIVVAAPTASVAAIDRLHVIVDEMHILDVKENFMGVNHYFEDNTLPSREDTITKINQIVLNWRLF